MRFDLKSQRRCLWARRRGPTPSTHTNQGALMLFTTSISTPTCRAIARQAIKLSNRAPRPEVSAQGPPLGVGFVGQAGCPPATEVLSSQIGFASIGAFYIGFNTLKSWVSACIHSLGMNTTKPCDSPCGLATGRAIFALRSHNAEARGQGTKVPGQHSTL